MIRAHLAPALARSPWTWRDSRFISGDSWIEPFDHPALELWAVRCDGATALMVRERKPSLSVCDPASPQSMTGRVYHDAVGRARMWDGAHVLIEHRPDRGYTITTGHAAVAPVYLTAGDDTLHIDWEYHRLASGLPCRLDAEETARRLTLRLHYTHRTVHREVYQLTERAAARFHAGRLAFRPPEPSLRDHARDLPDDAPVIDAYTNMLTAVLGDRHYTPEHTATELSGGMDSANVALTLADMHGAGLASGAVLHSGPAGAQQARRRDELVNLARTRDYTVNGEEHPPLNPASPHPYGPQEETYLDAQNALLTQWHRDGIRWAATGVGGDEMLSLSADEDTAPSMPAEDLPGWLGPTARDALLHPEEGRLAPAPPVSDSTLLAMAAGAPMYLRAGIWPLYPMADPHMFRFGQWLPHNWRQSKRLARARLEAVGCTHDVVHPQLRESFTPLLTAGMLRFAPGRIQSILDNGSPLLDGGYLDADRLRSLQRRLERGLIAPEELGAAHALRLHDALTQTSHPLPGAHHTELAAAGGNL